jgi:2-oxoglutarate ferredoxin oxidoreductase subunit gamma
MMKDGVVLYDPAMVEIDEDKPFQQVAVPAKDTAIDKLGRPIYANIIMLGALTKAAEEVLDKENMLETMLSIIPKFHDENRNAFEMGFAMVTS